MMSVTLLGKKTGECFSIENVIKIERDSKMWYLYRSDGACCWYDIKRCEIISVTVND